MTFERFDKMMDLLSMEVKQHFVPRSEFHSLEIKLSEANIKIVKLETQLESKQALSISTPEQTSQLGWFTPFKDDVNFFVGLKDL